MEVATDPRVPGLRYPGISQDYHGISCDKLVEVATDRSCPGIIPGHPGISLWR